MEKAFAKIKGSYEATENVNIWDAFLALTGGPGMTYVIDHFKPDIRRGKAMAGERFDKFWKIMDEANKKGWVAVLSSPKMPKSEESKDEES